MDDSFDSIDFNQSSDGESTNIEDVEGIVDISRYADNTFAFSNVNYITLRSHSYIAGYVLTISAAWPCAHDVGVYLFLIRIYCCCEIFFRSNMNYFLEICLLKLRVLSLVMKIIILKIQKAHHSLCICY